MKAIRHNEHKNYSCVTIFDTAFDYLIDERETNNLRVGGEPGIRSKMVEN